MCKFERQKKMKILLNIDLADESSPAWLVDSMWGAGNKKSSLLDKIIIY